MKSPRNTTQKFEPEMWKTVLKHIKQGGSMTALGGELKFTPTRWNEIIRADPELREINELYKKISVDNRKYFIR